VSDDDNLYSQLKKAHQLAKSSDANIFGVEIGIVTNVKDPDKLGRVKVCFPRLPGKPESSWARVVQPAGGDGRGFYWLPHVNDEVLVAFERGQANKPYVIGSLWNGKDKPMQDAYQDENTTIQVQTKSGHKLVLDDKKDAEQIILGDKSGKRTMTFDVKNKKFLVEAKEGDFSISAEKKIVLACEDIEIKTKKTGKITIGSKFNLKVAQKMQFKAGPQINMKADKVELNPTSFLDEVLAAIEEGAKAQAVAAAAAAAAPQTLAPVEGGGAAGGDEGAMGGGGPGGDLSSDAAPEGGAADAGAADEGGAEAGGADEGGADAGGGETPSEETTAAPSEETTQAPADTTTAAPEPAATTTSAPAATTTSAPAATTTAAPAATTTAAPAATTTAAPAATTTAAPAATTTAAPAGTTTAAPAATTTAAPAATTTAAPAGTTTAAPAATTTAAPAGTTTQPPGTTTTQQPAGTTTQAPGTTTTAPSGTTTHPATSTTHPATSTTHPGTTTTHAGPSVSLQIAAEGGDPGSEAESEFEKPLTLTWKVTAAASAELTGEQQASGITFDGTSGDGGELRMSVALGNAMPATLKMYDGDQVIGTWLFDLSAPEPMDSEPPSLTGDPPTVKCGSLLLGQPLALTLDDAGNGQGTIMVDPGPRMPITFTLTIKPKDGSSVDPATAKAKVTNLIATLKMGDGSPAPAGKKCKLELAVLAGGPADDGTQTA